MRIVLMTGEYKFIYVIGGIVAGVFIVGWLWAWFTGRNERLAKQSVRNGWGIVASEFGLTYAEDADGQTLAGTFGGHELVCEIRDFGKEDYPMLFTMAGMKIRNKSDVSFEIRLRTGPDTNANLYSLESNIRPISPNLAIGDDDWEEMRKGFENRNLEALGLDRYEIYSNNYDEAKKLFGKEDAWLINEILPVKFTATKGRLIVGKNQVVGDPEGIKNMLDLLRDFAEKLETSTE